MLKLANKDLVTGEELEASEIMNILHWAQELKDHRSEGFGGDLLKGKTLALLFDKPSLRTRASFIVAMNELGGHVIESVSDTRKHEEPEDLARVLSGYCHGIMIRTFAEDTVQRMAEASRIPVINGLSDQYHPCQILADLLTLKQAFGSLQGLRLAYIGDGNNILQSFFPVAEKVGLHVNYACPKDYGPKPEILAKYKKSGFLHAFSDPREAVQGADAVYTDVWTSMGFEKENEARLKAFRGFQVNEELLSLTGKSAKVMHCLPMVRGQEISATLPDAECSLIFQQSENRLHVQKALLIGLLGAKAKKEVAVGKGGRKVERSVRA